MRHLHTRALLRDLTLLSVLGSGLGLARLGLGDLPLVAEEPSAEDSACGLDADPGTSLVQRIPTGEAQVLVGRSDVTFVDARAAADYLAGHIPGALSLPAADAAGILEVSSVPIPVDNLVITYCDGLACEKSEYLGLLLHDRAGCEQVQVLDGGWSAWLAANADVVQGSRPEGGE